MTLLELTVVIVVLMMLVTTLFFGAQAWKRGSDRAMCIIHIQNVQKAVRSYANLYGHAPGASVADLQSRVMGMGSFVEAVPTCPGNGNYSFGDTSGPDTIPPIGELYLNCTLATSAQHKPPVYSDW